MHMFTGIINNFSKSFSSHLHITLHVTDGAYMEISEYKPSKEHNSATLYIYNLWLPCLSFFHFDSNFFGVGNTNHKCTMRASTHVVVVVVVHYCSSVEALLDRHFFFFFFLYEMFLGIGLSTLFGSDHIT